MNRFASMVGQQKNFGADTLRLTESCGSFNSKFYKYQVRLTNIALIQAALPKAAWTNVMLADRISTPGSQALPVLELALLAAYSPSTISSYSAALQHGSGGWSCGQSSNSFRNFINN